jgi:hypothetical protein
MTSIRTNLIAGKKGTVPDQPSVGARRDGPKGASHIRGLSPSSPLIAAALVALAAVAAADTPEDIPRLRQYSQGAQPIFRFAVLNGNLSLRSRAPSSFQIQSDLGAGRKESMSVRTNQGQTTLNYERVSLKEEVKISVAGTTGKASVSRLPRGSSSFVPIEFDQTPGEKTKLILGTGDHRQVYRAADLWRLAIAHPKQCQDHLFPVLDLLRPDRKLDAVVARIEMSLVAHAAEDTTAGDTHWAAMVKQLADDQFAKREAADRALRAGGNSALAYLRQLDFDRLDAEQQFRIRRILSALAGRNDEDSADEVAASISRDPEVWLALLSRPEAATRQTAARQLAKLLGQPIDVDPAAQPDSQKDKRDRLRERIEKK